MDPCDVAWRVWHDEQPGDEPRLHVAATFSPRGPARWRDVHVRALELHAGGQGWTPRETSVTALADGSFEVRASGAATLPAGTGASATLQLETSEGPQALELPETAVARID